MKAIKRWTTSITASFDALISQVENHDALVSSAIREMQEAGTRAKVQLSRVKRDGEKLRKRLAELHLSEEQWKERALKCAPLDETRALECLRRQKRIQREIAGLEEQSREHTRIERQLNDDMKIVEDKLTKLTQQRNLMRTRQSRAEALRIVRDDDSSLLYDIDDIFERWESKVTLYECEGGCGHEGGDALEEDFSSQEEEQELKKELQLLLQSAHQASNE